ncbi:MAG TPA: MOSC domain-containing protein [Acidimicrobiales bacterium]|nr:MOSC domain-containing protein [Acidimicrobiales bacterium]
MGDGRLVGVHRTPSRRAPVERLDEASVRADWGVEGDRHARPGSSRQVVVTEAEVLSALRLAPGATREQLTVSGAGPLGAGDVVTVGRTVRLELVRPRVPCAVMDGIRPGLCEELRGRGGWCARVRTGGTIRPGDPVGVDHHATGDPAWLQRYLDALATWEDRTHDGPPDDGWTTFRDRLAHLVAWDQRGAQRITALAAGAPQQHLGPTDIDAFNAAALDRLPPTTEQLWILHDDATTAVVDAARAAPEVAEPWVRSLTSHYREHS